MGTTALLNPLRRVGISLITRVLRKDIEESEAKKHPERKRYLKGAIALKHTKKKRPTREQKKQAKKDFKLKKKEEIKRYKTDPVYKLTTVPRATRSEKYDMGASVLRHEAKHGSSILTRTQSARVLKNWILPIYEGLDARTWVKPLNPFGRKKRKQFKIEEARAKLDLSGEV